MVRTYLIWKKEVETFFHHDLGKEVVVEKSFFEKRGGKKRGGGKLEKRGGTIRRPGPGP